MEKKTWVSWKYLVSWAVIVVLRDPIIFESFSGLFQVARQLGTKTKAALVQVAILRVVYPDLFRSGVKWKFPFALSPSTTWTNNICCEDVLYKCDGSAGVRTNSMNFLQEYWLGVASFFKGLLYFAKQGSKVPIQEAHSIHLFYIAISSAHILPDIFPWNLN